MQRLGKGHSSTRYPTPVNGRTPFAYKYDYSNKQKPPLRQMSAIGGSRNPSQLKHFGKGNEFTDSLPSKYIKRPQHQFPYVNTRGKENEENANPFQQTMLANSQEPVKDVFTGLNLFPQRSSLIGRSLSRPKGQFRECRPSCETESNPNILLEDVTSFDALQHSASVKSPKGSVLDTAQLTNFMLGDRLKRGRTLQHRDSSVGTNSYKSNKYKRQSLSTATGGANGSVRGSEESRDRGCITPTRLSTANNLTRRKTIFIMNDIAGVSHVQLRKLFNGKCKDLNLSTGATQEKRFWDYCEKSIKNRKFVLNECGLGVNSAKCIADIMRGNRHFAYLELVNNNIGNEGTKYICDAIKCNTSIISLNLASNCITSECGDNIFQMIANHPTIIDLNLSNDKNLHRNRLRARGMQLMPQCLSNNQILCHLNLADNGLGIDGLKLLCEGLEQNQILMELNLANNSLPESAIHILTQSILKGGLCELNLSNNQLTDSSLDDLAFILYKRTCNLEYINISNNKFGYIGTGKLFSSMRKNTVLKRLNMSENDISGPLLSQITSCLRNNKTLVYLNMNNCKINADGAKVIADGITYNESIHTLLLANNHIDYSGRAIGQAIKENKNLETLDVSNNCIGEKGVEGFAEGLVTNKTLRSLSLKDNKLMDGSGQLLLHAVAINQTLTKLNLQLNSIGYKYIDAIEEHISRNLQAYKKQKLPLIKNKLEQIKDELGEHLTVEAYKLDIQQRKMENERLMEREEKEFQCAREIEEYAGKTLQFKKNKMAQDGRKMDKHTKEIEDNIRCIEAKAEREIKLTNNNIEVLLDKNAILKRTVEKEYKVAHGRDLKAKMHLGELEQNLSHAANKCEFTEMIYKNKRRELEELRLELGENIEDEELQVLTEPCESTKKPKKKKKPQSKKKPKKIIKDRPVSGHGYTPKQNIQGWKSQNGKLSRKDKANKGGKIKKGRKNSIVDECINLNERFDSLSDEDEQFQLI